VGQGGAAKCEASGAANGPTGPDLAVIVEAWPNLPADVRTAVLEIVTKAIG